MEPKPKFLLVGIDQLGAPQVLIIDVHTRLGAQVVAIQQGFKFAVVLSAAELEEIYAEIKKPLT